MASFEDSHPKTQAWNLAPAVAIFFNFKNLKKVCTAVSLTEPSYDYSTRANKGRACHSKVLISHKNVRDKEIFVGLVFNAILMCLASQPKMYSLMRTQQPSKNIWYCFTFTWENSWDNCHLSETCINSKAGCQNRWHNCLFKWNLHPTRCKVDKYVLN